MKKEKKYQSLSPKENVVKESYPVEALDFAFGVEKVFLGHKQKKNDIYNIAVTAPYGAGKSSVVKSYLSKRKKIKPLYVSLSKFASLSNEGNLDENEIEGNILKQIFYHKRASFFNFSTLSRIKNTPLKKQLCGAVLVILLIIVLILEYCDILSFLLIRIIPEKKVENILSILIIATIALFAAFFVDFFIRRRCSRIVLKDAELELDTGKDSLISKSLDEIVYFFEVTKYNAVVFEDLDRLNTHTIFLKLRELNKILKDYEGIRRQIKFVYVLNDDVLNGKDRTKFFDFIIPIVPVINYTNAGNYLVTLVQEGNIEPLKHLDPDFIYDLGMYIDDLRVLKNAVNEFLVYNEVSESSYKKNIDDFVAEATIDTKNCIKETKRITKESKKVLRKVSLIETISKIKLFLKKKCSFLNNPIQLKRRGNEK
jgi:hypothetical protein